MSDYFSNEETVDLGQSEDERRQREYSQRFQQQEEDKEALEAAQAAADTAPEVEPTEPVIELSEGQEESSVVDNILRHAGDTFNAAKTVVKGADQVKSAISSGTGDFIFDSLGLIPWLKPVDQWWDENSPRSNHPAHKAIRDASSVIVPSLIGGGAVGAIGKATQVMKIPKAARIAGTVAANAGLDTGIVAISSNTAKDENIAETLNNWLGWDIPWATRDGDSPDVTKKKFYFENAGLAAGTELLTLAFSLAKNVRLVPESAEAAQAIKQTALEGQDSVTQAVEGIRQGRVDAQKAETLRRVKARDILDESHDSFIHEPAVSPNARAVQDVDVDPMMAKLDNYRIAHNIGTTHGRPRDVATTGTINDIASADSSIRASQIEEFYDANVAPRVAAQVGENVIPPEILNLHVDNVYNKVFNPDVPLAEIESLVDGMKVNVYEQYKYLGEQEFAILSSAFKRSLVEIYNPSAMRGSGLLTQQAGGNVADTAAAVNLIGDAADTGRQQQMIAEKLKLITKEVRANQYISGRALQLKNLVKNGDAAALNTFVMNDAKDFKKHMKKVQQNVDEFYQTFEDISKKNPEYLKPLILAYEATDGSVDQIYKLNRWAENNIGLIKKAFIDGEPEIPSQVVKGLWGAVYNHYLAGMAPIRAATGNAVLSAIKPASVFAGSAIHRDRDAFRRAMWTYGGFSENIKRGFKHMGQEWRLTNASPETAMRRGRADFRQSKIENFEALEAMSDVWSAKGEHGKTALWNFAKGLSWYNNNPFVRWGTNSLYAIDGFTNSLMASGSARAKAYDKLFKETGGAFDKDAFQKLQRKLYSEAFDKTGLLTDEAAKHASKEIALNLDDDLVKSFNHLIEKVPAARSLFLFPRTGVNSLKFTWSMAPGSSLIPAQTKARKVLTANTKQEMIEALAEHGLEYSDEAFKSLKYEYVGRQLMGGAAVTGAGIWALEGNLTGGGPHDHGERKRLMRMGWKPYHIKNPITGHWHSYRGFEPFDSFLGLTADAVYQANRVDSTITEDLFEKISFSIGANVSNKTFLSGFEPLVSMFSGDESAWNRFLANQAHALTPQPFAAGQRSILNSIVTPQLKDVESDFQSQMANKWKFLYNGNQHLQDLVDVYTGEPIRYQEPLTAFAQSMLPFFKSNGGMEKWRQWLISTGWDGLSRMEVNPIVPGEELTTRDRHWINNWIGKNANLAGQIEALMNSPDDFWNKKIKEYKKARGWKKQKDFPIKDLVVHQELDRIHQQAFRLGASELERHLENYSTLKQQKGRMRNALRRGDIPEALRTHGAVKQLRKETKPR